MLREFFVDGRFFRSPFALNCHLYGLRRHKMDTVDNAIIGITPKGIDMSDVSADGERIPLRSLRWAKMAKLSFDKRRLSITGLDGACMSLFAQSEYKARYLLEFCKAAHQALIHINKQYYLNPYAYPADIRSSFSYGDERSVDEPSCSRRSVSHNSSNSTSGIVSDKPGSDADKESEWADACATDAQCSHEGSPKSNSNSFNAVVQEEDVDISAEKASTASSAALPLPASLPFDIASLRSSSNPSSRSLPSVKETERTETEVEADEETSVHVRGEQPVTSTSVGVQASRSFDDDASGSVAAQYEASESEDATSSTGTLNDVPGDSGDQVQHSPRGSLSEQSNTFDGAADIPECAKCRFGSNRTFPDVEPSGSLPISGLPSLAQSLSPSHSVNLASILKARDKEGEAAAAAPKRDSAATLRGTTELLNVDIRQPPLYSEAVCSSAHGFTEERCLLRPSTNPHMKPRWTTVTGIAYPSELDYGERCRALLSSAHQAYSEPKLDQQMWSRSVSPSGGLSCAVQQPLMVPLSRPTPSNTPPFSSGSTAGMFQKQSRSGSRAAHAQLACTINRVQSMPAHSPSHLLQAGEVGCSSPHAAVSLHHAQSLAARSPVLETRQPPPYEHAVLQVRARYNQKVAASSTAGALGSGRDALHSQQSFTNDADDDVMLDSRIRQYPMMHALWQEHQQEGFTPSVSGLTASASAFSAASCPQPSCAPCGDIASPLSPSIRTEHVGSVGADENLFDPMVASHLRHPSSYQDLASLVLTPPHSAPIHPVSMHPLQLTQPSYAPFYAHTRHPPPVPYRGEYYFENPGIYRHYLPYVGAQQSSQSSWTPSASVLDLPPPPPYPPPRASPSPREAPMVM